MSGVDHAPRQPAADVVLERRELVVEHVHGGDPQPPRRERQVVRAVADREVEAALAPEAAHRAGAREQRAQLAQPRRAAVAAERRVLDAVQLEQLERLRVVARGHLDLVALPRAAAG